MIISLIFLQHVYSFKLTPIPSTGIPPIPLSGSAAVYDKKTNSIITIGGQKYTNSEMTSEVHVFNLNTNIWEMNTIISEYEPTLLIYHSVHLRKDRKVLAFGSYNEAFLLNLDGFSWSRIELKGDNLYDLRSSASTSVVLNDTEYLVLFGGLDQSGWMNSLFLIDTNQLITKKLPNNGNPPSPRNGASISYFNNSFYVFGYSVDDRTSGKESGSELYRYDLVFEFWEVVQTFGIPPGPRQNHKACIYDSELYIMYGAISELSIEFDTIFKFNFETSVWTLAAINTHHQSILSAGLQIDEKYYFIYGRNLSTFFNSISFIDFSKPGLQHEYLSVNWLSPSARVSHCTFVINENMYLFGGYYGDSFNDEVYYNDMWSFSFKYENWSSITVYGNTPSERSNFGWVVISGDVLVVFGGKGPNGYLNDMFYFKESSKTWNKIIAENVGPTSRSDSCMAYYNSILYIVGGRNDAGGLGEVWLYSFITNQFTLSSIKIDINLKIFIKNIISPYCWIEWSSKNHSLFIAGGADSGTFPNLNLIQFTFYEDTYLINISIFSDFMNRGIIGSETAVIRDKNSLIRLGGTVFTWMVFQTIIVFNISSKTLRPLKSSLNFSYYGHSAVHYKRSIYAFGGGIPLEIYKVYSRIRDNFIKIDFDNEDEFKLGCSPGTIEPNCEPCPSGSYYEDGKCLLCPKGKFNNLIASTSIDQCLPCPSGYFAKVEGSSRCLQCESTYDCPIGSIEPWYLENFKGNSSVQPSSYKSKRAYISGIIENLWYISVSVCVIICILSLISGFIWKYLKRIDFFVSSHSNNLGVAIVHRKTSFGGLYTIFFIFISTVTITGGFLSFNMDNISEIQALVPLISIDSSISTSFLSLQFIFYSYGGSCIENNLCHSKIKNQDIGLKYSSLTTSCSFSKNNCYLNLQYLNVELKSKTAEILISLEEHLSYSSGMTLNISSSSSIPDQISSVTLSFKTSSDDLVLKGPTPSKIYYKFTPSIFTSESSKWPDKETGYHIWTSQDPEIGSQADQESINLKMHLKTKVIISESDTAMLTQRLVNQTWLVFIGTLLGSVFGMMGTVAALMKFTEMFSDKYEKKKYRKVNLKEKIENRIVLEGHNDWFDYRKGNSKISPTIYEIVDD